ILVPPLSIYLFYGFFYAAFKEWRKYLLISLPVVIFLAFHSYFPNKQERFIIPILPFIIVLGSIGWSSFVSGSGFWEKREKLLKGSMVFFWIINLIMLAVISTTYSKRSRVESMTYLSDYKNIKSILVENTNQYDVNLLPGYYLGQWVIKLEVSKSIPIGKLPPWALENKERQPDFFIFEGDKDIERRVAEMEGFFPDMVYETTIYPGFIDKVLFWLNPVNENQNAYIYRNANLHPLKTGSSP
ncbi:MAG TPA: hypothetical protein VK994_00530, partial [Bacteroidales bacterium]|nr:hypothetical protein [Bacteroidales bacterium]